MSALSDGLRFYWDGASPTTSTGPDSGTVTLIGSPTTGASTAFGTGVTLNGTSQSVDTGKKFTHANGTIFLLAGSAAALGGSTTIACQSGDDAGNNVGLGWQATFNVNGNGVSVGTPSGDLWLAATWGSGGMRVFIDGSLNNTGAHTGAPSAPAGAFTFHIGCFHYSGGRIFHHAATPVIFAVFDAALSDGAIAALYNSDGSTLRTYLAGDGGIAISGSAATTGHGAQVPSTAVPL